MLSPQLHSHCFNGAFSGNQGHQPRAILVKGQRFGDGDAVSVRIERQLPLSQRSSSARGARTQKRPLKREQRNAMLALSGFATSFDHAGGSTQTHATVLADVVDRRISQRVEPVAFGADGVRQERPRAGNGYPVRRETIRPAKRGRQDFGDSVICHNMLICANLHFWWP